METPQNWGSCTRPLTHTTHSEIALVQVSHPGHETTDMNLEERQIFKQIHSSLRNKGRYFHKKNASLSSKFEKVKFWWSQVSPWQHRIRREKKRKKKKSATCSFISSCHLGTSASLLRLLTLSIPSIWIDLYHGF